MISGLTNESLNDADPKLNGVIILNLNVFVQVQ